jgi:DNA mismatch endonuclease (patch repair protein)
MTTLEASSSLTFKGLAPASARSSAAARGASRKTNTRCELVLRRELWRRGLRYRLHHGGLPGRPDVVFPSHKVVVFCDGDFWHGRDVDARLAKLARGHNASYWVAKVQRNIERDLHHTRDLETAGWIVLRFWETDLLRETSTIADRVVAILASRSATRPSRRPLVTPAT